MDIPVISSRSGPTSMSDAPTQRMGVSPIRQAMAQRGASVPAAPASGGTRKPAAKRRKKAEPKKHPMSEAQLAEAVAKTPHGMEAVKTPSGVEYREPRVYKGRFGIRLKKGETVLKPKPGGGGKRAPSSKAASSRGKDRQTRAQKRAANKAAWRAEKKKTAGKPREASKPKSKRTAERKAAKTAGKRKPPSRAAAARGRATAAKNRAAKA